MLAMAASIAAVYPHMNHIGGDGFWLIREPSGSVRAIMGAGRAGAKATRALLPRCRPRRHSGARAARARSPCPARLPAGCCAFEAASAPSRGKAAAADLLLVAAIRHARDGYTGDAQPGAA